MTIEKRPFGRTGHMSSAVIFGSAALKAADQGVTDRVLDLLLEYGVNHIDTAPRYGDAELRIGPWMDRHRDDFFLATKTDQWSFEGAKAQIRRSLERLRTDHLDLLQLHALTHPDQWEQALSPGGALDAVLQAREEGLVRFVGVTGHGWTVAAMHRRSLERFDFDSVLMPLELVLCASSNLCRRLRGHRRLCEQRNVAVQTIKALARGPWAAGAARNRETWYQPLEEEADIRAAVQWVLASPRLFLNSVGDMNLLPLVLQAADELGPVPDGAAMARLNACAGLASIFGL
jgi:aryl-alcohol dehydrogenase-like predicted oxidoreductase